MITIGRHKWPNWVKKAVGKKKRMEIKEHKGRYYCYETKSIWNKKLKTPSRTSKYIGVVSQRGIRAAHEIKLNGIYEYGNIEFALDSMQEITKHLKETFPDDWKIILSFALNRLIDPRPIKSMQSWYEKTYLAKNLQAPFSPNTISSVLERIGENTKAQLEFFEKLKREGEKIIYDGSVIFSSSEENNLLEYGYNKDNLMLPKANIVLAFSHDRFIPIFFRLLPGSIHEIASLDVLFEHLGKDFILIADKGFFSEDKINAMEGKGAKFVIPLKRNSKLIDYAAKLESFFMYRKRPIKFTRFMRGKFIVYLYEDLSLRNDEEKTYFTLLSNGKKPVFNEEWAGKISLISNVVDEPQKIYEMWKMRDEVEKAFNVLQNILDTDRPYVHKETTFRGYLFASIVALIAYYIVLAKLKDAGINDKISVADVMLELSKLYVIDVNGKEILSERSKRVRKLLKALKAKNIVTKKLRS